MFIFFLFKKSKNIQKIKKYSKNKKRKVCASAHDSTKPLFQKLNFFYKNTNVKALCLVFIQQYFGRTAVSISQDTQVLV
jgi:hypothetical protein